MSGSKTFSLISANEAWILPNGKPTPAFYMYLLYRLGNGPLVPDNSANNIWSGLNNFTGGLEIDGVPAVDLSSTQTLSDKSLEGVTNGGNAASGVVGEYLSSVVLAGGAIGLSTGVSADITTLALAAGDYDVWGSVVFSPAASTTVTALEGWIGNASATPPTLPNGGAMVSIQTAFTTGVIQALPVGTQRVTSSGPVTLYLSVQAAFGTSTMTGFGGMWARRRR